MIQTVEGQNLLTRNLQLKDILDESSDDMESDDDELAIPTYTPQGTDFIFGVGPIHEDLLFFHPPISQVLLYWHVYLENCECLLRLMHTPSFTPIIENAVRNGFQGLHKSDELLMFAFYFAAVTSLTDKDTIHHFREERGALLPKYELAIKHGLTRARLLHTQDLKVLQALVLYLVCPSPSFCSKVCTDMFRHASQTQTPKFQLLSGT